MPRRLLLLVLALLAQLLAPSGAQAQGVGDVTATFDDADVSIMNGTIGAATLTITSTKLQPVTVRVSYASTHAMVGELDRSEVMLTNGQSAKVKLDLYPSFALAPGSYPVAVNVTEVGTPLSPGRSWTPPLNVTITPVVEDPELPFLHVGLQPNVPVERTVATGNSTQVWFTVLTRSPEPETYTIRTVLPAGWTATHEANVTVRSDPGGQRTTNLTITASGSAAAGPGRLIVEGARANLTRVADLRLLVGNATAPPAPPQDETPGSPDNGTAPPSNQTSLPSNGTSPPSNETSPPPTHETTSANESDGTPPPSRDNETEEDAQPPPHEDPAPEDEPLAEARVVLVVEPDPVKIAPGGTARATLRATADANATLSLRLDLPPALGSDLTERTLELRAGEPVEVEFLLEADLALENGTLLDASLLAIDGRVLEARFQVLILTPPLPLERTSTPTPPPVGSGETGVVQGATWAGIAAGVGGSALALVWTRKRWAIAFAGLYARLRPQTVLQHPIRQRMMTVTQATPGLTIRELQRALDLANGSTMHHLRTLEKAGVLNIVQDGMLRRVYPVGHGRVEPTPALADRILHVIEQKGETTPADIVQALGSTRQAVQYHLRKMVRDGTLRARIDGRETWLRIDPVKRMATSPLRRAET